jgi:hypothetical protein
METEGPMVTITLPMYDWALITTVMSSDLNRYREDSEFHAEIRRVAAHIEHANTRATP